MTTETESGAPEVAAEVTDAVVLTPEQQLEKDVSGVDPADPAHEAERPEGDKPEAKPKQTAQQRIDELTWRANEAERREQAALDRLAKATPPASEAQPKPEDGDGEKKPNPDDFEFGVTDEGYIEALAEWKANEKINERFAERDARTDVVRTIESFKTRAAEAFPDGEPDGLKAYRALETVPVVLQDLVLKTAAGPKLAEHYGANPDALKALLDMPTHLQAFEIGQVQARLSASATGDAPVKKTASDAPDPPSHQSRGTGGKFKVDPATDDFAAFDKAY